MRPRNSVMAELLLLVYITSCLCLMVNCNSIAVERQDIKLDDDGGYTDLLVGIGDRVEEDHTIIDKLKKYFTEASKVLHTATKRRLYFKNITIVVPTNWTGYPNSTQPKADETYRRSRVLVDKANSAWGDIPYTLQPGPCGEEGEYIHVTPDYLSKNSSLDVTHRPDKTLVREFAHLRWGLFDEDIPITDKISSRFYTYDDQLLPVGCSGRFIGSYKDISTNENHCQITSDGLFPPTCIYEPTRTDSTGSLLNFEYLNEIVDFCGSSADVPHNVLAPNSQNRMCKRSAWDVMNSLDDFEVDYNILRDGADPSDPLFKMVQIQLPPTTESTTTLAPSTTTPAAEREANCEQDIVCLCLDVSESMDTSNRIGIMSQSVQTYILTHLRNDTAVGIVSFESTPHLLADMTVITSSAIRSYLASRVPTVANGGTGIGGGLQKCQEILQTYAGNQMNKTRILLLSDGKEKNLPSIAEVLPELVADGVVIDVVQYGQGAVSYNVGTQTGGREIYVSDQTGNVGLDLFFQETASRSCEEMYHEAVVSSSEIVLKPGISKYSGTQYLDVTIGVNTKLVFQYSGEIDVEVFTPENNSIIKTHYPDSRVVEVVIEEQVASRIDFIITKLTNINTRVTVVTMVTSSPVPGVEPIVISNKINNDSIVFANDTQLVGHVGVFQGLTPVYGLTINLILEQPDGSVSVIPYTDDGTGKDSTPDDGVYTGFLLAHQFEGDGWVCGTFNIMSSFSLLERNGRRKRCTDCAAGLGNVTRMVSGITVKVHNWFPVPDLTPPEDITDARLLYAAGNGDNVFVIGWTAPGDDLNIGQVASYEFAVGINSSLSSLVPLPTEAILSDVSTYLVPAGTELELHINASQIKLNMFDKKKLANISTYYFRLRSADAKGNTANWSNPVSASYINPDDYKTLISQQDEKITLAMYICNSLAVIMVVVIAAVGVCRYRRRGKCAAVAKSDTKMLKDPQGLSLISDLQITSL